MPPAAAKAPRAAAASAIPAATAEAIAATDELRYSNDSEPGISRRKAGAGFYYVDSKGRRVKDEATLQRIRKLAVPPAYRDVWICADARGHIQATGIDARGRKQYRYHPKWREVRDAHKFERMISFGKALPRIRRRISHDLKLKGMPREKVLATIVRLLERTLIRVGNDEYARENRSYGLTTIRNRHVKVRGDTVRFHFRGKHGIVHELELEDPRAAKVVRNCLDLPGQDLFQYVDDDRTVHDVGSGDVNDYLREIGGESFTAKDFRTWHATADALAALSGHTFAHQKEAKQKVKEVLQTIAGQLRNTPTMCRKCYVNPVVIDAFMAGELRASALRGETERVRLLQLLMRTPAGAGFAGASTQGRAAARRRTARVVKHAPRAPRRAHPARRRSPASPRNAQQH